MLNVVTYKNENMGTYKSLCASFSCGNIVIDNFLKSYDAVDPSICRTYLLIDKEDENISLLGFYSLATDAVLETYNNAPCFSGGAIRILMFAIDEKFQGKKIAEENKTQTIASFLLNYCINMIKEIVEDNVGAAYVVLSSTTRGYNFYTHDDLFSELEDSLLLTYHEDNGEGCIDLYSDLFDLY